MAKKKYHFISGLPRSGSTLLTGILIQNPRFYSNISDQLLNFFLGIVNSTYDRASSTLIDENVMLDSVNGLIDGYYKRIDKKVIFNCNRGWNKNVEYLKKINPNFKVICCVRDYKLILNSFEMIYKNRRLIDPINNAIYNRTNDNTLTVWHRTNYLANESFVRFAYNAMKEAYYGPYRNHLLLVEYNDLTMNPKETMQKVYDFIGEPYYNHDFDNVIYSNVEYDELLSAPGLHTVRKKVEYKEPEIVLPPDLMQTYSNWEFWR